MFIRVDPAKSASNNLFVMDNDNDLNSLQNRRQLNCSEGVHYTHPHANLVETQTIVCVTTGATIFTIIYSI